MIPVVTAGATAGLGACLLVIAVVGRREPLARAVGRLHRTNSLPTGATTSGGVGGWLVTRLGRERVVGSRAADLAVLDRGAEQYGAHLATAAIVGLLAPALATAALRLTGVTVSLFIPVWACLAAGALGVLIVAANVRDRARVERRALRLQLGAYLDMLAMLLSAGEADEQALQLAAIGGDGRLFAALHRVYRDAARTGAPMLSGMALLGERWAVPELVEIAAAGSLAASDGAAVRRTLMTKARAMRTSQLAEEETDARLRTNKLGLPQILLACGFLLLILYPAFVGLIDGIRTPTT